ncbi:hypothetical protein [Lysinibacillus sp. JNUCC 51]|uniref:hypothetical protein n=1 Tax=Lysinibacillus sp. JNUCC-51 TaxID=2792479 RepID=UPI001935A3DC|nr:hypothetical protein JNUCC51_09290 [Lysinibacillus sp. JNUCC-51]
MGFEEKIVKLLWKEGRCREELLEIYEEAPDDEDFVLLKMKLTDEVISFKSENCFEA